MKKPFFKRLSKEDWFAGAMALVFLGVILIQVIAGMMPASVGVKDDQIPADAVTLTGAIWAEQARSAFWTWDPKEAWALITWIIYAVYLHMRLRRKRRRLFYL